MRDLLASLLSKDPARRLQTPLELIDRIELAGYEHRGAEADPRRHWKTQGCVPLIGSLLAHNYHLEALANESQAGAADPIFRAEDVAGGRRVAVQLLDRHQPLEAMRAGIERLVAQPHPNLVQNHAFSSCRGQPFIVSEWIDGFPLSDLLRARRSGLRPAEVLRLIRQAAEACEHSRVHRLGRLELRPDLLRLHFSVPMAAQALQRELLLRPMEEWPDFSLKLKIKTDFSVEPRLISAEATVENAVRELGNLTAELLGGGENSTLAFEGVSSRTVNGKANPLSAVHLVLDQTLADPPVFASVTDFVTALAATLKTEEHRFTTAAGRVS